MRSSWLLALLILAVSVVGLSMGATLPLVALRLHEAGASSLTIGVLSALPAAGMMLAALLVNRLCRHLNARQLYLGGFALCLLAVLPLIPAHAPLLWLTAARLLLGLAMGVLVILGESWVNELCDERRRGQLVALYAACFTGCQLGGPAMISLFGTQGPWPASLVAAANALILLLLWRHLPAELSEPEAEGPRRFSLLGFIRVAPALCLGVLFFAFFDSLVLSLFPVYASGHGYAVGIAALMASVILAGDMLFQVPLGWLSDRMERRVLHLGCGLLTLALGLALPWLIGTPAALWPALVVLGAAAGGIYTLALVLIGQHFRGPDLVTANACVGLLWGVGSLIGPLLSGVLMNLGPQGLPLSLCLGASLFVVAAFAALPQMRRAFSH